MARKMPARQWRSPEFDRMVEQFGRGCEPERGARATRIAERAAVVLRAVEHIEPRMDGHDKTWTFWLRTDRGTLADYGSFEELRDEGLVTSPAEAEALWCEEYPDEVTWHRVSLLLYERRLFVTLDTRKQLQVNLEQKTVAGVEIRDTEVKAFLFWLFDQLEAEAKACIADPRAYGGFLSACLPPRKRLGKIRRRVLWDAADDIVREDRELGASKVKAFVRVVSRLDERRRIASMTVRRFLEYCEIGYEALGYLAEDQASARDQYRAQADGRHGGLLDIDPDSPLAFAEWFRGRAWAGAHPWEIIRGGNSTHVSLYVVETAKGWTLRLEGFRRVVEVVTIAIAFARHKVPFVLADRDDLVKKVQGSDYVGVLPDDLAGADCGSLFPPADRVRDCVSPWRDPVLAAAVSAATVWSPVERPRLVTRRLTYRSRRRRPKLGTP